MAAGSDRARRGQELRQWPTPISRAVRRDPDLWVLEIEDRAGRHLFEGKML